MSLVGTRPPTVDEWDKYELHHRARLATKPGLTGMWQVSGRSNITDLGADIASIKFDKILLRLADLLDMSSYRVSKPILYHNVEQMSEESAFHWISHLLTKGYSLRTEYEK